MEATGTEVGKSEEAFPPFERLFMAMLVVGVVCITEAF